MSSISQSAGPSIIDNQRQSENINEEAQYSDEMDLDPRSLRRSRSPLLKKASSPKHTKNKKYLDKDRLSKKYFLKESILDKAVAKSILSKS